MYSLVDDCVLGLWASFHSTLYREIMHNYYITDDFERMCTANGNVLNVEGVGDVGITLPNMAMWTLQKVRLF